MGAIRLAAGLAPGERGAKQWHHNPGPGWREDKSHGTHGWRGGRAGFGVCDRTVAPGVSKTISCLWGEASLPYGRRAANLTRGHVTKRGRMFDPNAKPMLQNSAPYPREQARPHGPTSTRYNLRRVFSQAAVPRASNRNGELASHWP